MAWLTRENPRSYSRSPKDPDMETLSYWLARIEPLIRAETDDEIIVVFANRTGIEEEAVYAGTSAILGIQAGEVKVYGILGRGEKELLVVDTNKSPQA
jgi:protein N-terminal amidase